MFTRKSLVCLLRRVPETLSTSWNYSILEFYPMQTLGNPINCCCPKKREREGKKGRYQNHFLDIKTWWKRKKRNNCLFRKPCVSLTLTHKESPLIKNPNKRFWTPRLSFDSRKFQPNWPRYSITGIPYIIATNLSQTSPYCP